MRSYSHLSVDERDLIGGAVDRAIARALGRAKATISRELQRNALPSGGYSPLHAAGAYQLRRRREAILEREAALRLFVGIGSPREWTPEQISGWLKSGNEPRLRAIGCETIYAFIYRTAQKAAPLWRYLTRRVGGNARRICYQGFDFRKGKPKTPFATRSRPFGWRTTVRSHRANMPAFDAMS
jgi:IS30 family transposase